MNVKHVIEVAGISSCILEFFNGLLLLIMIHSRESSIVSLLTGKKIAIITLFIEKNENHFKSVSIILFTYNRYL